MKACSLNHVSTGMTDISCNWTVYTSQYLDQETMDKTYLYSGASGRMSNQYTGSFSSIDHVDENERGLVAI